MFITILYYKVSLRGSRKKEGMFGVHRKETLKSMKVGRERGRREREKKKEVKDYFLAECFSG